MTASEVVQSLAQVSAALVDEYDLAGALVEVVVESRDAVGADAAGLIVLNGQDHLELLTATSHRAADIEAYQAASGEGPCSACMTELAPVLATYEEVAARWPGLAERMSATGYEMILATPMRWHGRALGGLNLLWRTAADLDDNAVTVTQVFSDALTLAVLNARPVPEQMTRELLDEALRGRVILEQAKGVIAQLEGVSMEEAFARLLETARRECERLSDVARVVVERASGAEAAG